MSLKKRTGIIFIATGGTGGHVFPAMALASELTESYQAECHFLLDKRAEKFLKKSDVVNKHILHAATMTSKNPLALLKTAYLIMMGVISSLRLMIKYRPDCVFVFGGYPSLPPAIAAWILRITIAVHEQNATMGKVNRLIAKTADRVFLSMQPCRRMPNIKPEIVYAFGNPLRQEFYTAKPTINAQDKQKRLLIVGGSQGAQFFTQTIPPLIQKMPQEIKHTLFITQQAHEKDVETLKHFYKEQNIQADIQPFIDDVAQQMCDATCVISRSGATSIAEIIELCCPSILIPFAASIESDQYYNAHYLAKRQAACMVEEKDSDCLYETVYSLLCDDDKRKTMAQALNTIKIDNPGRKIAKHMNDFLHETIYQ